MPKMTRAQAERALQAGSLSPRQVLQEEEDFPNRHVRLRAFKMEGFSDDRMADLKKISSTAHKKAEESSSPLPRWAQKVLMPS